MKRVLAYTTEMASLMQTTEHKIDEEKGKNEKDFAQIQGWEAKGGMDLGITWI